MWSVEKGERETRKRIESKCTTKDTGANTRLPLSPPPSPFPFPFINLLVFYWLNVALLHLDRLPLTSLLLNSIIDSCSVGNLSFSANFRRTRAPKMSTLPAAGFSLEEIDDVQDFPWVWIWICCFFSLCVCERVEYVCICVSIIGWC